MPRPRYIVTAADVAHAKSYLENRMRNRDLKLAEDASYHETELELIAAGQETRREMRAKCVNGWCEQYLSKEEWRKLKLAIRKRRERRARTDLKTVTITDRAHGFLARLAERDGVTYSEVLEKHLLRALNAKR